MKGFRYTIVLGALALLALFLLYPLSLVLDASLDPGEQSSKGSGEVE